ncbi:putative glycoside hydrolase [Photobacterium sp. DNB22_13_2]
MELKKKHLALLIAAFIGLSGCVEDAKDTDGSGNSGDVTNPDNGGGDNGGGDNGGGDNGGSDNGGGDNGGGDNGGGDNGGGDNGGDLKLPREVALYYKADDKEESPYAMYLYDNNGDALAIGNDNNIVHNNITMTGETSVNDPLTVTVSEDKASIVFSSDDKAYDLNTANGNDNQNGTLQFKVITNSFDVLNEAGEENKVALSMASGENKAYIDVTSAVSASISADQPQLIRVPLSCFQNQENGIDISKVNIAMSLESSGAIEYQFSDARIIANSVTDKPGANNVQGCLNNGESIVLTEEASVLAQSVRRGAAWVQEGATQTISTTRGNGIQLNPGNSTEEGTIRYNGIHYTADKNWDENNRSILTFAIDLTKNLKDMTIPRLDMSHYMSGSLQMKYFMPSNTIELPAGADTYLVIKMETPVASATGEVTGGYPSSEAVYYNLTKEKVALGSVHEIELPLKKFFTNADGLVNLNALQYVEKLVTHIQQGGPNEEPLYSNLAEFKYGLADIKLVIPTDETEVPEE